MFSEPKSIREDPLTAKTNKGCEEDVQGALEGHNGPQGGGDSFFFFINLFFYFWLCWVFVAAHGLSLVAASGGYSSLWCMGFSLWWLLLLWGMGYRHAGSSSCGTRAQ